MLRLDRRTGDSPQSPAGVPVEWRPLPSAWRYGFFRAFAVTRGRTGMNARPCVFQSTSKS